MMILSGINFLPKGGHGDNLLPPVIAVMMFMTTLAVVGALAIGDGVRNWSRTLDDQVTVQIITSDDNVRQAHSAAALRLLRATPGIASAEILADSEILDMIAPWLGEIPVNSGLPLPSLIDVRLRPGASLDTRAISERLQIVAPTARIDDHSTWLTDILDLAQLIRLTLAAVAVLVVLCTAAIVIFGCRAGLAAHSDTIEIMHHLGAEDGLIAGAFDRRYFLHGLKGGVYGLIVAALVLFGISRLSDRLGDGLVVALSPDPVSLWWLLLLPLGTACLTAITARITVRRVLLALM